MKKKLGKILCGAVSTAAIVGGAAYVIKKILGQNDIIDSDESEDDYEDEFEDEFDDDFEQVFSDNNKDEREYVTINITDDSDKADVKKDEVSDDKTEEKNTEDELKEETSKEEATQEDSVKATQESN